jgi:sterol desaturase/sphingolipid hydroxylase (fatty acid hydroxylase superfamily)
MELQNMFGLTRGKLFGEPPLYVDKTKKPGMTDMPKPTIITWLRNSPFVLITSPNFVWATISLLVYGFAPYDLSATSAAAISPINLEFLALRLPLWLSLVLGYFGFWHISLYLFNLANRPFIENRQYNWDKLVHNAFWTTSGIFIWTIYENIICFLWATGRISYISDFTSFNTIHGAARFIAVLMAIPVWRSIHFYFAHRLLHYGPLYQQVHSLHHRNTDIEPFSGLCMHPVEHLYYYACILPSLVFYVSPYAFLWNGVHLLLSPAASHSGYEDHFQSDMFHYLHHRYFECNYAGSDAAFMDIYFGTFKASFNENPADRDGPKPRDDAKSSLRIIPTREFAVYLALSFASVAIWAIPAIQSYDVTDTQAIQLASSVGFGPVILATFISTVFGKGATVKPVQMNLLANLIHLGVGSIFCSLPVTYMCYLTLSSKN